MKKHTEKPPIDDLFARKLGEASLRPNSDSYGRLQARMKPNAQEGRTIFWRNLAVQRYMALAACLLLVAGFGWLYWPSGNEFTPEGRQVANNRAVTPQQRPDRRGQVALEEMQKTSTKSTLANASVADRPRPVSPSVEQDRRQVATTEQPTKQVRNKHSEQSFAVPGLVEDKTAKSARANSIDGVAKTAEPTDKLSGPSTPLPPTNAAIANASTRTVSTERVLVVTIAEPEALVAARQAAQTISEDLLTLAANDKPAREAKVAGWWQQIKRVKQGEVFARRDTGGDEGGLLSRAYNGLKQSLDKDKSAKQ